MRAVHGLSQSELSRVSGVARGTIWRMESCRDDTSLLQARMCTMVALARVFGITVDELSRGHLVRPMLDSHQCSNE